MLRWIRNLFLAGVIMLALGVIALVIAGTADDAAPSDVAIVLGSKVELNGKPSARLAARLDQGAAMYRRRLAPFLLVSGGVGREGFDEALVMRDYLVSKGVPASAILVDSLGVTTEATAVNSAAIMRTRGWTRAIVVTQYFHVPRTRMALRHAGIDKVTSTYPRFVEARDIYSTLRELAALPAYWLSAH